MRKAVSEYLGLTDSEKKELLENAAIVFDTNVLLNLYRYSSSTREALIKAMELYRKQLWLPYQVAVEFMKNRPKTIEDNVGKYGKLLSAGESFVERCAQDLRIKSNDEECVKLKEYISKWIEEKKQRDLSVTDCSDDSILDKILNLYEGRVGKAYSEKELDVIKAEGKKRYEKKIPPGYKDAKKANENSDNNAYGDLIYWKQIIDYAKEKSVDIILITGDKKEDWWFILDGFKTIGPRPELIKEFTDNTSRKAYLYDINQFIKISGIDLDNQAVEEIQSISMNPDTNTNNIDNVDYSEILSELIELEKKNKARLSSIKGYERLIKEGVATERQVYHYHSTVASYKQAKKRIIQLNEQISFYPPDVVADGLYWLTRGHIKT